MPVGKGRDRVVKGAKARKPGGVPWHGVLFFLGLLAMVGQIYAVDFVAGGAPLQKALFLVDSSILLVVAYANKQHMLNAVNTVIVVSAALAFLPPLGTAYTLALIMPLSVALVAYLYAKGHYKKEPISIVGTVGFILLAFGFAINGSNYPLLLAGALGFGGLILAIYSFGHYALYRVRVQLIFALLNAIFCVGPLIMFFGHFGV